MCRALNSAHYPLPTTPVTFCCTILRETPAKCVSRQLNRQPLRARRQHLPFNHMRSSILSIRRENSMPSTRNPHNPLITPRSITASRPDFEVLGTFNAGVTTYRDEVIMLVRVAERPLQTKPDCVRYPEMLANGEIVVREVNRND